MRRRFCHHSGEVDGRQPNESGLCVFQAVTHIIEAEVVTGWVIDASELAKPVASLCERDSNLPAAAPPTARRARTDIGCERHQVTGSVVQHLCRRGSRLACTKPLLRRHWSRWPSVPGSRTAFVCPWAFLATGTKGDVDYPGCASLYRFQATNLYPLPQRCTRPVEGEGKCTTHMMVDASQNRSNTLRRVCPACRES
jgi:hypothetical protein